MYILAAGGPALPLERLVRLMLNIERGRRIYEWAPGSTPAPRPPAEAPPFLTITVPGRAPGAPATEWDLTPTVGLVVYRPEPGFDPGAVAARLRDLFAERAEDAHLLAPLRVEIAAQVALTHAGRTRPGTVLGPGVPRKKPVEGWAAGGVHPCRRILRWDLAARDLPRGSAARARDLPHVSAGAAFTWYLAPAEVLAGVSAVETPAEFNALTASVFLDTALPPGAEPPAPVPDPHREAFCLFGVRPLPPPVARYREARGLRQDCFVLRGVVVVYVEDTPGRGHFEVAPEPGAVSDLAPWPAAPQAPPAEDAGQTGGAKKTEGASTTGGANTTGDADTTGGAEKTEGARTTGGKTPGGEGRAAPPGLCARCGLPLWGRYYRLADPRLRPARLPVCRWCVGALPHEGAALAPARHPRTIRQAYARGPYEDLAPLLGVAVRPVELGAPLYRADAPWRPERVYAVEGAGGAPAWLAYFIPRRRLEERPFLCLGHPELRAHPLEAVGFRCPSGALVRAPLP